MRRRAFTLVELLVVIAIISLLISILAPSLRTAKDIARLAVCATNIKGTGTAILIYSETNRNWIPPVSPNSYNAGNKPVYRDMYTADNPWKAERSITWTSQFLIEYYQGLGLLYQGGQTSNANLFYCPSRTDPASDYSRAFYPVVWDSEGRPDGKGGWKRHRTSYILNPLSSDKEILAPNSGMQAALLDRKDTSTPMVMDLICTEITEGTLSGTIHTKPSPAWNISYPDSHVERKGGKAADTLAADGDPEGNWALFVNTLKLMK
jgi:prepilin-type N-terminal cleavage/methylation domain-containing protein